MSAGKSQKQDDVKIVNEQNKTIAEKAVNAEKTETTMASSGTVPEAIKSDDSDKDDETRVVMKPGGRKHLRLKIPETGQSMVVEKKRNNVYPYKPHFSL